jgi:Short C-terminal domain
MKIGEDGASQKVRVMPGRAASAIQVVLGTAFLIFGAVFVFSQAANAGSSEPELKILLILFGIIWIIACGAIAGYGVYCLAKRKPAALCTIEFETVQPTSEANGETGPADFDARLRKLESLKKEGLITDDEFNRKRAEIMAAKW